MKRTLVIAAFALVGCSTHVLPASTPTPLTMPLRLYATTAAIPLMEDLIARYVEIAPNVRFDTLTGDYEAMQRATNLQGAFRISEAGKLAILDKRIVLIDDVMTSGATANAAARVLLRAGARRVDALTFARVVTGG